MQLISITPIIEAYTFSVFSKSFFDDLGESDESDDLEKGAKHKYVKREPTGKPKPKWRYWYRNPLGGIVSSDGIKVGTSFRHGAGEGKGHFQVMATHDDGTLTVKHDETGKEQKVTVEELREILHGGDHEVGEKPQDMFERLKKDLIQTYKTGNKAQRKKMRDKMKKFAQGYPSFAEKVQDAMDDASFDSEPYPPKKSKPAEDTPSLDEQKLKYYDQYKKLADRGDDYQKVAAEAAQYAEQLQDVALKKMAQDFTDAVISAVMNAKAAKPIDNEMLDTAFSTLSYFTDKAKKLAGQAQDNKKTEEEQKKKAEAEKKAKAKKKSPKAAAKESEEKTTPQASKKIDPQKAKDEFYKKTGMNREFDVIEKLANKTPLDVVKEYWSKPEDREAFEKYAEKSGGWWKDTRTGHSFSMNAAMKRELMELDAAHAVFGKPEPMTPVGGTTLPETQEKTPGKAPLTSEGVKKAVADPSKLQLAGSKSTGSSQGRIVSTPDAPNKKFMLKNDQPVKTHAEVAGSQIAKMVMGDKSVAADLIDLSSASSNVKGGGDKKIGCIQEMVPNNGMLPKSKSELVKLPKSVQQDIVASHVANWLVSDADAHGGQYMLTEDGQGAIRIDFGQAYKHIGNDKLDTDYHPNSQYGESKPAPLLLLEAYKEGKVDLDLDDPKIEAAIKKAESIPDSDIRNAMDAYASSVQSTFGKSKESLIQAAIKRKNNIRQDFKKFFGDLKAARSSVKKSFALYSKHRTFALI